MPVICKSFESCSECKDFSDIEVHEKELIITKR